MEYKEYRNVDKSAWPKGEWNDEPDKVQFLTAVGLPALVVRGPSGALCGYVGVGQQHPWFGKDYGDVEPCPSVHGGLTFSDRCDPRPDAKEHGICHLVGPDEDDNIWWLGFDCAHSGDYCPKYGLIVPSFGVRRETYKNLDYVKSEIEALAQQILATNSAL